uniref:Uncharacterized protein n=1 Tax=Arundo donax TaxID=35708 RepID=A0A0A9C4P9_ARUDO
MFHHFVLCYLVSSCSICHLYTLSVEGFVTSFTVPPSILLTLQVCGLTV